jgi:hypothetical protein
MKYSIATDKWTTIKDLGIGGNRLDFNVRDGTLFSELSKIYTINPTTGALSARIINGNGKIRKDLAFVRTELLCAFFEVYKLQLDQNIYKALKITNGLGVFNVHLTFDSDDNIWLANPLLLI